VSNVIGYHNGNFVIETLEFQTPDHSRIPGVNQDAVQGTAQWNRDKFAEVFHMN
jgi:hypothetical protein